MKVGLARSAWCNPYPVGKLSRLESLTKFEAHARATLVHRLPKLIRCRLLCRCKPQERCDGDVLVSLYREFVLEPPPAQQAATEPPEDQQHGSLAMRAPDPLPQLRIALLSAGQRRTGSVRHWGEKIAKSIRVTAVIDDFDVEMTRLMIS